MKTIKDILVIQLKKKFNWINVEYYKTYSIKQLEYLIENNLIKS